MAELNVEVVSAEKSEWTGKAKLVVCRTVNGDLGVMPGHTPLLAVLAPGAVIVQGADGGDTTINVDGGFLSVDDDVVLIVVDQVLTDDAARSVSAAH